MPTRSGKTIAKKAGKGKAPPKKQANKADDAQELPSKIMIQDKHANAMDNPITMLTWAIKMSDKDKVRKIAWYVKDPASNKYLNWNMKHVQAPVEEFKMEKLTKPSKDPRYVVVDTPSDFAALPMPGEPNGEAARQRSA